MSETESKDPTLYESAQKALNAARGSDTDQLSYERWWDEDAGHGHSDTVRTNDGSVEIQKYSYAYENRRNPDLLRPHIDNDAKVVLKRDGEKTQTEYVSSIGTFEDTVDRPEIHDTLYETRIERKDSEGSVVYTHETKDPKLAKKVASVAAQRIMNIADASNESEKDTWKDFTEEGLTDFLENHGINADTWGSGSAKTVSHLLRELQNNESELTESEGTLIRHVRALMINVRCVVNGETYILREEKQVFKDGRVRIRDMGVSLGEKLTADEEPGDAVSRALTEELGISAADSTFVKEDATSKESPSYPGLTTEFQKYTYDAHIAPSDFNPEGYIEHQPDKSTYFAWQKELV